MLTLKIDAAQQLFYGFLSLILLYIIWYQTYRLFKYDMREGDEYSKEMKSFVACTVSGCASIPLVIYGRGFFDVWVWTKLFYPELWLAHQAIEKLVK